VNDTTGALRPSIDIIMPVLDEAVDIGRHLSQLRRRPSLNAVIVVDGGSRDGTCEVVRALIDNDASADGVSVHLVEAPCGRALQMNAGAAKSRADALLFLHADTQLPPGAIEQVREAICRGAAWGCFNTRLDGEHGLFRVIEWFMNARSAVTHIATGDQAIFVRSDVFHMLEGYAPIALMEDVELCSRLKWVGQPAHIRSSVIASTRRWRARGIVRTVMLMWSLRLLYWFGVAPATLHRLYGVSR
jgi:rSAM/selenodomain-associated transferase 2